MTKTVEAAEKFVTLSSPDGPMEAWLPYWSREREDGVVLYFQREERDCFRAALATVLQLPYEEVPAQRLDKPGTHADEISEWVRCAEWAVERGYRMKFANTIPREGSPTFLAIGPPGSDRYRHVLAVVNGRVFDPASGFRLPVGFERVESREVEFIVTFEERTPA